MSKQVNIHKFKNILLCVCVIKKIKKMFWNREIPNSKQARAREGILESPAGDGI